MNDVLQRVVSDFLQPAIRDFLERATSATSNEWLLQWVTSDSLQRVTSDFTMRNEERVNFNK